MDVTAAHRNPGAALFYSGFLPQTCGLKHLPSKLHAFLPSKLLPNYSPISLINQKFAIAPHMFRMSLEL